jgi:hypothetical protein
VEVKLVLVPILVERNSESESEMRDVNIACHIKAHFSAFIAYLNSDISIT